MRRRKNYFTAPPDAPPPVSVRVARRLRFSEVDALAIAWHGGYPRFFEDAHTELMRKLGLTYEHYRRHGYGAPVVQCHVDYFEPLLLDEEFFVTASLVWHDGARLNVEYQIEKSSGEIAASGYTVQMFFSLDGHTPALLSPALLDECRERWKRGEFHE